MAFVDTDATTHVKFEFLIVPLEPNFSATWMLMQLTVESEALCSLGRY